MHVKPHTMRLLVLAVTSLLFSRLVFALFRDPEGPNLLIVFVTAFVIYAVSLGAYTFIPVESRFKKFILTLLFQVALVGVLYFLGITF